MLGARRSCRPSAGGPGPGPGWPARSPEEAHLQSISGSGTTGAAGERAGPSGGGWSQALMPPAAAAELAALMRNHRRPPFLSVILASPCRGPSTHSYTFQGSRSRIRTPRLTALVTPSWNLYKTAKRAFPAPPAASPPFAAAAALACRCSFS